MYHWMLFKRWEQAVAPKVNLSEELEEIERLLHEPINGITRAKRMDLLEGESFQSMMSLMGG